MTPDCELVSTYAREGSEMAFRALVSRHVNLVFSAAYRQVGDVGLAEEVTQNVFVALALKAPRLAGHETLAGWLHRTAILEAKARIRAELRRRRREEVAAVFASVQSEGRGVTDEVVSLLDEALLNLREADRSVLVLRFLEERSLREVGTILGVEEDTARKRVSRALQRLADHFRALGIAVPATAGSTLITQAVGASPAVPAGLAASASGAGLSAGGAASGFQLLILQMMTLTKTQTAVIGLLLVTLPLGWQWHAHGETRQAHEELSTHLVDQQSELADVEAEVDRLRASLARAQADTFNAARRLETLEDRRATMPAESAPYTWDDSLAVARIPKTLVRRMSLNGVANKRGELTPQIQDALQFTESERAGVQEAINRFVAKYHAAQASAYRRVEPEERDLNGRLPEEVRVFEISGLQETVAALRQELFAELAVILDSERYNLFTQSLRDWMPIDDQPGGINTGMAVFAEDHRVRFYAYPGQDDGAGEPFLGWGFSSKGSMNATMRIADIPDFLRPHLQDWIDQTMADRAAASANEGSAGQGNP